MTRSYADIVNVKGGTMRRDPRGPRHSKEGGHDFDLPSDNPAVIEGRTRYPHMLVSGDPQPLKPGGYNTKIGATVMKGKWTGMPIYTLTLHERDTCPRSCFHWRSCFGNKMNWAKRQEAGPELEAMLECQLLGLELMYPKGFLVRLHVLGDFYSVHYAELWRGWLEQFTALRVFGYTAWSPDDPIGESIYRTMMEKSDQFAMRFSNRDWARDSTVSIRRAEDAPAGVIVCPAQTGASSGCFSCGFCWNSRRPVAFIEH